MGQLSENQNYKNIISIVWKFSQILGSGSHNLMWCQFVLILIQ